MLSGGWRLATIPRTIWTSGVAGGAPWSDGLETTLAGEGYVLQALLMAFVVRAGWWMAGMRLARDWYEMRGETLTGRRVNAENVRLNYN